MHAASSTISALVLQYALALTISMGYFTNALAQSAAPIEHAAEDHRHHVMSSGRATGAAHDIRVAFDLIGEGGQVVRAGDFSGSFLLIGFGFTHCDYVCPTLSANIARVISTSDRPVKGAIISVDTERDTPEITHQYAQGFHRDLIGLSGTYSQVAEAASNFRVKYVVTKTPSSFTVQHTASIFLVDPHGELIDVYALNVISDDIVTSIAGWKSE